MSLKVEIIASINPKTYFPNAKHILEYAFSIGERHYFRFDDLLNTGYDRALKALVYYKELDMNCDRPILLAHTQAFDNALTETKITIDTLMKLKDLNDQLKARLALPKEPELLYKLASIVYFDQSEDPYTYEFGYAQKKIKAWKKIDIAAFFLQIPLKELVPYLAHAGENLETFSQMIDRATHQHLDKLSALLSPEQRTTLQSRSSLSPAP